MIRLNRNNVAIIPIRDADKIGSLYIPDTAKERVDQGIIKYLGPDCKFAQIGSYVTFSGYNGTLFDIADPEHPDRPSETLIIMSEDFLNCELVDMPSTDVPGLFFRDKDGEYFPATYEQAVWLCARAMQDAPWRAFNPVTGQGINVQPVVPGYDEKQYAYEKGKK
jgi:hypothetical protein